MTDRFPNRDAGSIKNRKLWAWIKEEHGGSCAAASAKTRGQVSDRMMRRYLAGAAATCHKASWIVWASGGRVKSRDLGAYGAKLAPEVKE